MGNLNGQRRYKRVEGVELIEVPDGYIAYKAGSAEAGSEAVLFLNPTAAIVLELSDGTNTLFDIALQIADAYSLPLAPLREIEGCLDTLLAEALITTAIDPEGIAVEAVNLLFSKLNSFATNIRNGFSRFRKFNPVLCRFRRLILPFRISHIWGPKNTDSGKNDVIVVCLLRNGAPYVASFLKHYRSLGIKHFVFLDNNSTDDTVSHLSREEGVIVLASKAAYSVYENVMKTYLAQTYCKERWCLCVDIDELFDFPHSNTLDIGNFFTYLNSNKYNFVVCQMLDMFSDQDLDKVNISPGDNLREKFPYYDISAVKKSKYFAADKQVMRIRMHHGGIRRQFFGTAGGLTKASLFFVQDDIELFWNWHHVKNGKMADISCVLLHYPFHKTFVDKVKEAVESGRYGFLVNDEYQAYFNGIKAHKNLNFKTPTSRRLNNIEQLIHEEFIVVSNAYLSWVDKKRRI